MSHEGVFDFYRDRISACPSYGFYQGRVLLQCVLSASRADDLLTDSELSEIISLCDLMHKKLMEANYNENWD